MCDDTGEAGKACVMTQDAGDAGDARVMTEDVQEGRHNNVAGQAVNGKIRGRVPCLQDAREEDREKKKTRGRKKSRRRKKTERRQEKKEERPVQIVLSLSLFYNLPLSAYLF